MIQTAIHRLSSGAMKTLGEMTGKSRAADGSDSHGSVAARPRPLPSAAAGAGETPRRSVNIGPEVGRPTARVRRPEVDSDGAPALRSAPLVKVGLRSPRPGGWLRPDFRLCAAAGPL